MARTTKLAQHKKMCRQFFEHIEKGDKFYVFLDQEPVFDGMTGERKETETYHVSFSVLTEGMIEYDSKYLSSEDTEILKREYRPYFASFVADVQRHEAEKIMELREKWHVAQFLTSPMENVGGDMQIDGQFLTSVSPVKPWDGRFIVFQGDAVDENVLNRINSIYKWNVPNTFLSSNDKDIEDKLNHIWEEDSPCKIDIYNVGHGNADYIFGKKRRILYDIGCNYRPSQTASRFPKAVNAFGSLTPSCVILSHWDADHILGCVYTSHRVFDVKWIAPNLISRTTPKPTVNAARLALYLMQLKNLLLVDRDSGMRKVAAIECPQNQEIRLWMGGGSDKYVKSSTNCEGLMLEFYDHNQRKPHILLSGDVPYACMPQNLKEKIDYLHVPHHCSNMDLTNLRATAAGGSAAILTTNRYKSGGFNYDANHYFELNQRFDKVLLTICHPDGGDSTALSIRINCKQGTWSWRPKH